MIEKMAVFMSRSIKYADPDGSVSEELLAYEIGRKLNFYSIVVLTVVLGWLTGHLAGSITSLVGFGALRKFSGGIHMPSLTSCTVVSVLIFTIVPFIPLSKETTMLFTLLSLITMIITHYGRSKRLVISAIIILSNIVILSPVLAISYAVQTLTVLMKGGENVKQSIARFVSKKLELSAKNSVGTQKTFLGEQKLPAELESLKKENK